MAALSPDQIIALAPDAGSARAGKELASARKWRGLGQNNQAAWGECQGSAKDPYQTQIDLSEPAFKCTCPSRKFPCKHALGLFLLLAEQPASFGQGTPPGWVSEWLAKRAQAASKTAPPAKEKSPAEPAAAPAAAAKRAAKREERVRQGLADLDLWLCDLLRQGLSAAQAKPQSFWEAPAARLVDAQAAGAARKMRALAAVPGTGEGWQGRLLAQIGALYLLAAGYPHLERLSAPTQADLRAQIGWTQDQDELLQQPGVRDQWLVLGKRVEEEPLAGLGRSAFLRVQRSWLWGKTSRRPALILNFAAPGQPLEAGWMPGTRLDAELVFFPGGFPLRALLKSQRAAPVADPYLPGCPDVLAANQAYAAALSANPWLELFPVALQQVIPFQAGERWGLRDAQGRCLFLAPGFSAVWTLAALSGGHGLDVFGEWDGDNYWPLSVRADGRLILF